MSSSIRLRCILSLILPVSLLLPAAAMDAVPDPFARRLQTGWLPELCVNQANSVAPEPITRSWAKPRAGEPVRILALCNSTQQYEALAIARSIDATIDIIPWWLVYSWQENKDPDTMNYLRFCLSTKRYDVIIMAGGWVSSIPDDVETRIAALIQNDGVGFVYAMPGIFPRVPSMQGAISPILDPLLPLTLDPSGYKEETVTAVRRNRRTKAASSPGSAPTMPSSKASPASIA